MTNPGVRGGRAMLELAEREALDEAKRRLRAQLIDHPDAGVRTLGHIAELPDNHPAVQRIAAALRARAADTPSVKP